MIIRPYQEKDKERVRFICLNSDGPCNLSEKGKLFILSTYCDYFIEQEGHNCFVAVDENDNAVAYVICTENYDAYSKCFSREYLPRIRKSSLINWFKAKNSATLQAKYKSEYPAHLHIDVLPEYQRMGLGHMLIDELCRHLTAKGISGVMLTAGAGNEKGASFYKKYGFTLIEEEKGAVAFGLKLK